MSPSHPSHVTFGPFRLDRSSRRLYRSGTNVPVRPKAFAVLDQLVARAGRLMTKDELLAAVWPDTAVTDTVLKVCVREIRDALGDDAETPRFIETAHRLGYRFIGQTSPTNLPAPLSTLVGRRREIDEIANTVPHARLVTLVGAGGSGKSRLALEVGGVSEEAFEHGAWWVDLAAIDDEQFLPQTVASALGVRDQPGEELTRLLTRFLATRSLLLIVDNCEHLIAGAAALLHTLLQAAPRLHVLATSREPLRTEGERIWPVPPLSLPPAGAPHSEMAYDCEAVQLFAERAKAALSSFTLSGSAGRSVVEIVRCLDGMPLAIELAAARVGALPVEQMAARLHDCFDVLGAGRRAALPRHQTLRAAIDWSYQLLAEDERRLLRQLSVFVDTFSLDAAEHVGRTAADLDGFVFDVMTRLIDKSLVVVTERPDGGRWRYRVLETVRQFAHEQLLAGADAPAAFAGHCQYFKRLAEEVEPRINTRDRQSCLTTLGREHANLRVALERSSRMGEHESASRLASALFWFWFHAGHWREGRAFLGVAIRCETPATRSRARALLGDGVLAWAEGNQADAAPRLEECAAIARAVQDSSTLAHALHFLAMVRLAAGHAASGRPLAEEAVALARGLDDPFCLTIALASHGVLLLALGELDAASAALEESVQRSRQADDVWAVALPLRNLAIIACRRGEYERARRLLEDSLQGLRALGERWFVSRSIETLAQVLVAQEEHDRAARLFGAAEGLREAVGASVLAMYRADYDRAIVAARDALGPQVFERCWKEGRRQTPDAVVAYALGESITMV